MRRAKSNVAVRMGSRHVWKQAWIPPDRVRVAPAGTLAVHHVTDQTENQMAPAGRVAQSIRHAGRIWALPQRARTMAGFRLGARW